MVDITHKAHTLRQAIAEAVVKVSSSETMAAIQNKTVPKGDVLEVARTAGLFAAKRTWEMIPDCHPLPVEYTGISYEMEALTVRIRMEVKTIYKTGVEVEAMHGVSVVALTLYDMLKPIDKGVEIQRIRLVEKKGGKSDFKKHFPQALKASVVLCSDPVNSGKKEDHAGQEILNRLKNHGLEVASYSIIGQKKSAIETQLQIRMNDAPDLLIFAGGTGLTGNDKTPEIVRPFLDKEVPGMAEWMRHYGQSRTPYAMISRSMAGIIGKTLVWVIPGSARGAAETMDALLPHGLHALIPIRKNNA